MHMICLNVQHEAYFVWTQVMTEIMISPFIIIYKLLLLFD
jgi:hypothetical protein